MDKSPKLEDLPLEELKGWIAAQGIDITSYGGQKQVAALLRVPYRTMQDWLRGDRKPPAMLRWAMAAIEVGAGPWEKQP